MHRLVLAAIAVAAGGITADVIVDQRSRIGVQTDGALTSRGREGSYTQRMGGLFMRVVVVQMVCLVLAGCGAGQQSVEFANGQPLRLTRVVMYQNGLAHFERRGRARSGTVDLRVPAAQVDDVLRSLTVVDGGEATITGVRMLPGG